TLKHMQIQGIRAGEQFGAVEMKTDKEIKLMNDIEWKYVKPLVDPSTVKSFLEHNQVSLPAELVECIEKNNGGRPSIKLFNTDLGKEYVFKSLLSYNEADVENIYTIYPALFKNTKLFPIGTDSAGNFICYDTADNSYYLWKHETNNKEKYDDDGNLTKTDVNITYTDEDGSTRRTKVVTESKSGGEN
ncbi:MAG: SMI1/KNR4 family protein, partial [Oscillospiraceae bacterium]